jgi:protein-tyrosine phosphatase
MTSKDLPVPFPYSYWVRPGLLLAGEYPGDTDDAAVRTRLAALLNLGIRTFLDLTEAHEASDYAKILQVMAAEEGLEITCKRIPVCDRRVPVESILADILDFIDGSIARGKPLFVHCYGGIGRTGTAVGCYLMRHGLAESAGVIAKIAELRSRVPGDYDCSPHTEEQVQRVKTWDKDR